MEIYKAQITQPQSPPPMFKNHGCQLKFLVTLQKRSRGCMLKNLYVERQTQKGFPYLHYYNCTNYNKSETISKAIEDWKEKKKSYHWTIYEFPPFGKLSLEFSESALRLHAHSLRSRSERKQQGLNSAIFGTGFQRCKHMNTEGHSNRKLPVQKPANARQNPSKKPQIKQTNKKGNDGLYWVMVNMYLTQTLHRKRGSRHLLLLLQ